MTDPIDELIHSFSSVLNIDANNKNESNKNAITKIQKWYKSFFEFKKNNIIKIQQWIRDINEKIKTKCKFIINFLSRYPDIMNKCFMEISLICTKFPPRKNENKFIYGKLSEKSLLNTFNAIKFNCIDLDVAHTSGSEYKNDIKMLKLKFSIKTQKNRGGVILINTLSTAKHTINMTLMLCCIQTRKLYIIPSTVVNQKIFLKQDSGSFSYKGSLFTWIDNHHPEYVYQFPELTPEQKIIINNTQEVIIYDYLYNTFIKSN